MYDISMEANTAVSCHPRFFMSSEIGLQQIHIHEDLNLKTMTNILFRRQKIEKRHALNEKTKEKQFFGLDPYGNGQSMALIAIDSLKGEK